MVALFPNPEPLLNCIITQKDPKGFIVAVFFKVQMGFYC